ncbi:IQ motif, EF-hand binding site [Dillenia turbinata]|uniref:IQ motif, EF-hand binding site n=1 Tax=Dillenia turbinata TaxID=194707 RepID=A0AAN8VC57_9MAGN
MQVEDEGIEIQVLVVLYSGVGAMGRSPGKWIKTVLFGKKSSKSNLSKGREKAANEKDVWASAKAMDVNLDSGPPTAIHQASELVHGSERNLEENIQDAEITVPQNQSVVAQRITKVAEKNDPETTRLEEAATRAQAAFRGHLAHQEFHDLKGIIRLQALVRGHLVRRQAASSLYCLLGIVKLQAYARGNKVRHSDIGLELRRKGILLKYLDGRLVAATNTSTLIAKVSSNAFARMLLATSPTPMPLHLQYDSADPNAIFVWLERWSASQFWKPLPRPMKVHDSKPEKQGNSQTSEPESVRTKHSKRKVPAANVDGTLSSTTSEFEKPKRNLRKVISHPVDSAQEHPQSELEKVKRNLRKVHNPVTEGLAQSDLEIKKSKPIVAKISNSSDPEVIEETKTYTTENLKEETNEVVPNLPPVEKSPEPALETEVNSLHEDQSSHQLEPTESIEKDENIPMINGENLKEDSSNMVKKLSQRTPASVKQEHAENGLKSSPTLPSYMAATESAKAKLRGQGSPRLGQDAAEKPDVTRRHSLPAPTNGKISSQSPRTQRLAQPVAKGGMKATRDGTNGKVVQAEWRR